MLAEVERPIPLLTTVKRSGDHNRSDGIVGAGGNQQIGGWIEFQRCGREAVSAEDF